MKSRFTIIIFSILVWACASETQDCANPEQKSDIKMAEQSELALLMKSIHKDAKSWKSMIKSEEELPDSVDIYHSLVNSTPTKPEVTGPVFEGFAKHYQESLDSLLKADNIDLEKRAYNNLVISCVNCHQAYCPGPIPTIEKLYFHKAISASEAQ